MNKNAHKQSAMCWATAPRRGCPSPSPHCVTALVLGDYPAGIALKDRAVELITKKAFITVVRVFAPAHGERLHLVTPHAPTTSKDSGLRVCC